jgi:hypothetical protein
LPHRVAHLGLPVATIVAEERVPSQERVLPAPSTT